MEFICKLIRNTENITNAGLYLIHKLCIRVPVFSTKPEVETYLANFNSTFLFFLKEDRFSPDLIFVHPPKELTEEQVKKINEQWDFCIRTNQFEMEFPL